MMDVPVDPRLVVVTHDPVNVETRLDLHEGTTTPNDLFFMRNRFRIPKVDAESWHLSVSGLVESERIISYAELRTMPKVSLLVTTECAGNGRSGMRPPPVGEPWGHGAVSTAVWTGVPLSTILDGAGVESRAREVVFEGQDRGPTGEEGKIVPFARSLPLSKAMHPDTLLAYEMNHEALPVAHGFPVRLIVPDWYGMASVKWLSSIRVIGDGFRGFFQLERYVLMGEHFPSAIQLTAASVRSVIAYPVPHQRLEATDHVIRGFAWSGCAPVQNVEVSVDGGDTWRRAVFTSRAEVHAWRAWEYEWKPADTGPAQLQSRGRDADGNVQPVEATWNSFGYACNAIMTVPVVIEAAN